LATRREGVPKDSKKSFSKDKKYIFGPHEREGGRRKKVVRRVKEVCFNVFSPRGKKGEVVSSFGHKRPSVVRKTSKKLFEG